MSFEQGDRVLVLSTTEGSIAHSFGAPPGTIGMVVGVGGVLDCCADPDECYAVLVHNDLGIPGMLCVHEKNLRLMNNLN